MKKTIFFVFFLAFSNIAFTQGYSDTLHITHYDLTLDATDFTNRTISGVAQLQAVAKADNLTQMVLDLQGLTVDSVFINNQARNFQQQGHKLHISHNLSMGDTVNARIHYHGTPAVDSQWGGFYFSGEYCYNMGVAFHDQPHNYGRCWFPCLDVFTDKSSYTMHIRTQAGKTAICNGMLSSVQTLPDSTKMWNWNLEETIPTYLASVAVGPYQLYTDTFQGSQHNIPIDIYAQPNTINNVAASFVNLKEILRLYEELFGPYRWPRVGYVAVNFSSGAMEHATNIAYPNVAINGNTYYQSLFAHELFHHWFGDLITCKRAEEMWINEGFASYSEALVEGLFPATENANGYLDNIRNVHFSTLKGIVKDDGGHYALDNVPQEVTYGTHSYQKGSLIIHTLRNYMGDSLFFGGFRELLNHYAWQNISSEELFDFLSQYSGINLTDFYEGWVHEPGFPHYSIDSIEHIQGDSYRIHLKQKRLGGTALVNNNRLELTFIANDGRIHTIDNVIFSGQTAQTEATIPFTPAIGIVDYFEKITDATIDYTPKVIAGETSTCSNANLTIKLDNAADTLLVRVEHNLVEPDNIDQMPEGIYAISNNHYWNIGVAYNGDDTPVGQLQFKYQAASASNIDYNLMSGYNKNNLKLLYRASTSEPWRIIESTISGTNNNGSLRSDIIMAGQYCLAIGEEGASVTDREKGIKMTITPNPASTELNIQIDNADGKISAYIYGSDGKSVKNMKLKNGSNRLNTANFKSGLYFIRIKDEYGRNAVTTFIKQ